jgi:quercetin dioxygenase-like cupin family protein
MQEDGMPGPVILRHVHPSDLELLPGKVISEGGDLRVLSGSQYGLRTSVMRSKVAPGSGPRPHRHPHAEVFVVDDGQGRFDVGGVSIDAEAGDMIIVPTDAVHAFTNTGTSMLRLTAIHENARAVTLFADGTRRD